jgi:hypothetical protein
MREVAGSTPGLDPKWTHAEHLVIRVADRLVYSSTYSFTDLLVL